MSRTPPPSDSLWANDDDDPRIEADPVLRAMIEKGGGEG